MFYIFATVKLIQGKILKACKGRLFKRNTIRIMIEFKKYISIENSFYKDYVNENRLVNVVSHIGEVKIPRDFGRLVKAMYDDVMEDFLKEHRDAHESVDKSEQRVFNSNLNKKIISLIKAMYIAAQ